MSSSEALTLAQNQGMDLVEISPQAKPPTCKIMDYGKWKFKNKKRDKQSRKNQVKVSIKEIQLRPRTGEADLQIKLGKVREFLAIGHKVRVNLRFFGREMAHKELGFDILKRIEKELQSVAQIESPAKMERRVLFTVFAPLSSSKSSPKPASKAPSAPSKAPSAPPKTPSAPSSSSKSS